MISQQEMRNSHQLLAVESAPCFALVRVGKVSPMRIQIPGAQVIA